MAGIDDELIDRVVTRHPAPIADAIVALAAAESVHERRDRVVEAFRVILRYFAAVALGARLAKRPAEGDGEQVPRLVETLRARSLTDGQWWNLVRELVKPWAKRAAEHPIPALVEVLANPKLNREIDALLGMRKSETVAHGTTGSKEGVVAILAEREPVLARLLAATEPIHLAARLVVGDTADQVKSLTGATPSRALYRRTPLAPTGRAPEPGRCYLIDAANQVICDLDPLVRFGPPAVAALPEVFFLDGRTPRGGGRYLSLPAASERSEPQVWERLDAAFATPPPAADDAARTARPYRGLARFEKRDAAMFFGRDAEIQELANRIRAHPMVTLTGPSGSGKSSLLAAGVTAALAVPADDPEAHAGRRGAIAVTVRPGRDLARELAAALELEDVPRAELVATARSRAGDRLLVVIVDQAEELLTLAESPEAAAAAAALLVELGAGEAMTSPTRVVLSVREDFFAQLARLAPLRHVYDRQVMVLGPLDRAAMLRALVEPAAAFGVRYEPGVAEAMVDEILDRPGALPLLQFAADKLWDVRTLDGDGATISRAEYDSIHGVAGALATHAEALYAQLLPNQQEAARAVMLRLVTREGTRAVIPRDELAVLPDAAPVLARLEDARLISTRQDVEGTGVSELIHEALIAHWPRLADWRKAEGDGAAHVARVADAARTWRRGDRVRDLLWRGDVLAEHRRWAERAPLQLTPDEVVFITASEDAERRARRNRRLLAAGLTLILSGVAVVSLVLWRRASSAEAAASADATRAEQSAHSLALQAMVARAREYAATSHTVEELAVLRALAAAGEDGKQLALANGFQWKAHQRLAYALPDEVKTFARANDGAVTTALVDGGAALAQFDDRGREVHRLALAPHPAVPAGTENRFLVPVAGVSPRGRYAIVVECTGPRCRSEDARDVETNDAAIRVREIATGKQLVALGGRAVGNDTIAFSADDAVLALRDDHRDTKLRILRTDGSAPERTLDVGDCGGAFLLSRHGERLAIACASAVRAFDLATGASASLPTENGEPILSSFDESDLRFFDLPYAIEWHVAAGATERTLARPRTREVAMWEPGAAPAGKLPADDGAHRAADPGYPRDFRANALHAEARQDPHFPIGFASISLTEPLHPLSYEDEWVLYEGSEAVVHGEDLPVVQRNSRCLAPPGDLAHTVTSLEHGNKLLVDEIELTPFGEGTRMKVTQLSNAQLPIRAYRPARIAASEACAQWEQVADIATRVSLPLEGGYNRLADGRLVVDFDGKTVVVDHAGKTLELAGRYRFAERDYLRGSTYSAQVDAVDLATTPPKIYHLGPHPEEGSHDAMDVVGAVVFPLPDDRHTVVPLANPTARYDLPAQMSYTPRSPVAVIPADGDAGVDVVRLADHQITHRPDLAFDDTFVLDDSHGRLIAKGDEVIAVAGSAPPVELEHDPGERIDWDRQRVDATERYVLSGDSVWELATGKRLVHAPGAIGTRFVGDEVWWLASPQAPHLVRVSLTSPAHARTDVPLAVAQLPFFEALELVDAAADLEPARVAVHYRVDRTWEASALFDATTGAPLFVGPNTTYMLGDWIALHGRVVIPDFDVAHLSHNVGARTNLRACEGDLRVVAVLPPPAADSIWAPKAACQTSSSSPSRAGTTSTP